MRYTRRLLLGLLITLVTLSACGLDVQMQADATPQPVNDATTSVALETSQQPTPDIQATVEAAIRATQAAQQVTAAPQAQIAETTVAAQMITTARPAETITAPTTSQQSAAPAVAQGENASSAAQQSDPTVFNPSAGEGGASKINIQLVFDASGSMAEDIGGETKIDAARRAMKQVIGTIPTDNPRLNVGFRVFGHKGDNTDAGKAESCRSTELLVPMNGVNADLLSQQVDLYAPTGWTPISLALQNAGEDMQSGENVKNVIIMVTDGEETCDADPCKVSAALAQSDAEVRIDVVGFGLTPDVADTLKCISENSGGTYTDAQNGDALAKTLEETISAAIQRSYLRITSIGADGQPTNQLKLTALNDAQGNQVALTDPRLGTAQPVNHIADGDALFELPAGTYTFIVDVDPSVGGVGLIGSTQMEGREVTYTAIVAEGQETFAIIGIGSLILGDDGAAREFVCGLAVEVLLDGEWKRAKGPGLNVLCTGGLKFDEAYPLTPGSYRLVDTAGADALLSEFMIEPGKTVTLRLSGSA